MTRCICQSGRFYIFAETSLCDQIHEIADFLRQKTIQRSNCSEQQPGKLYYKVSIIEMPDSEIVPLACKKDERRYTSTHDSMIMLAFQQYNHMVYGSDLKTQKCIYCGNGSEQANTWVLRRSAGSRTIFWAAS
ncbi:hypothetical protein CHS0354_035109 [Potamilus streckersoni]|uniref:Uncharacterized protein n=1 Tax=Potamilus streckersoni TaxID=2493646 RepID=A0AAE0RTX8_9BIVA|nr:hypothetical protein CHS0354_035109 [Potamilus streckersoni]